MPYTRATERFVPQNVKIDTEALTDEAALVRVLIPVGAYTQDSTVKTSAGPLGFRGKLVRAYLSAFVLPIGGTLTVSLVAYDASANAEIVLTDAINPEVAANVAREGTALVVAATNVALDSLDTLEAHTVASDDAVGTAQVNGYIVAFFRPLNDVTPAFTDVGNAT